MTTETSTTIRRGLPQDIPAALGLIQQLAKYEKCADQVSISEQELLDDGFGEQPRFLLWVAEVNAEVKGIALCYWKYSTWKGSCLYLEDLVVDEKCRGMGLGKALLDTVAQFAGSEQAGRLEWQVLDWNQPAINFYEKLGAVLDSEWINCKLTKEQLERL